MKVVFDGCQGNISFNYSNTLHTVDCAVGKYFPTPANDTVIIVENAGYATLNYFVNATSLNKFENVINITM